MDNNTKGFARLYYVDGIKKVTGYWVVVCPYNNFKYAWYIHTERSDILLLTFFITSTSMIVYLFVTRSSLEQNNRKLISLHNNGEGDKHARAAHASR
jgi:hypothetical protein